MAVVTVSNEEFVFKLRENRSCIKHSYRVPDMVVMVHCLLYDESFVYLHNLTHGINTLTLTVQWS